MRFLFTYAFIFSLSLLSAQNARGQTSSADGVLINADSMERDSTKGFVRLKGNVQVVFQGQHLSCDNAELNLKTQMITATGHVILTNPKVHVEGERLLFNYKQNTGFIYSGFVQSGQIVFEGEVIEKSSDVRYIATNAEYTACDTCPPGWSFSGRVIDAELGGYARINRPIFRIGGWPVMILPHLIVPLMSSRQSGFLVPTLDHTGLGGLSIGESYFWAIDRSQDLTLTARWYEFRGFKAHEDYRYVLSESSRGRMTGAWIRDRKLQDELRNLQGANKTGNPLDRWFVNYTHYFELPGNYIQRADINTVSDLRYARDFPDELKGHRAPALESSASLTKLSANYSASAEVSVYRNLLKRYPLADNDDAVHRFPEIRFSLKEQQLFDHGPYFRLDSDYVNFARSKSSYDDLQKDTRTPLLWSPGCNCDGLGSQGEIPRDGTFDPQTDLMRTGQRLDIRPQLSYPFQIARKFDILPSVLYRETQYRFYTNETIEKDFGSTADRRYVQTDIRARTELTRVFGLDDPSTQSNRWKHSIEPEIGFSQIPWMKRPNHPFFGDYKGVQYNRQYDPPVSDKDLTNKNTGIQFDYEDRNFDRQVVDFALTNRITKKVWVNGAPEYRTAALFTLYQAYDLNEARVSNPHPWSSLQGLLDVRFDHFETNTRAEYFGYANVTNLSSRVKAMLTPGNFIQASFVRNFNVAPDTYNVEGETRNFSVGGGIQSEYLQAVGQIDFALLTGKIQSWSYDLNIRPPGRCWLIRVEARQVLNGDKQIRGSFNFEFGGDSKRQSKFM